jgi:hypothetical protein
MCHKIPWPHHRTEVVNKNENKQGHFLELIHHNTTYIQGAEYKWIPPLQMH